MGKLASAERSTCCTPISASRTACRLRCQFSAVRVAGSHLRRRPPPPPAIGLDLNVAAHQVVVRGRGLFAELAGSVKVGGSTAAPQPFGSFHMVRGNLSIAGQTLNFEKGEVGFNGGSLTDPSLDFVATSANTP